MLNPADWTWNVPRFTEYEPVCTIEARSTPSLTGRVLVPQGERITRRRGINVSSVRIHYFRESVRSKELQPTTHSFCQTDFKSVVPGTPLGFHFLKRIWRNAENRNS